MDINPLINIIDHLLADTRRRQGELRTLLRPQSSVRDEIDASDARDVERLLESIEQELEGERSRLRTRQ